MDDANTKRVVIVGGEDAMRAIVRAIERGERVIVDGGGARMEKIERLGADRKEAQGPGGEGEATVQAAEPAVATPTFEEILASLESETCAACGGRKVWMQPFCNTDFLALTIWMRKSVTSVDATYLDAGEKKIALGFAQAYRAALRHLQLNPTRAKQVPVRGGEWRYQSDEDLEKAGFKMQRHDRCEVPGCDQRIIWYWTPNGGRMPVNLENSQPHKTSCKDPEYFKRRHEAKVAAAQQKRLQTFARKKKQRRRA